ncbi:hypothetical protein HYPSUDRAFT_49181, partial [Hypholoma sublateritium FD-334 SS-4]
ICAVHVLVVAFRVSSFGGCLEVAGLFFGPCCVRIPIFLFTFAFASCFRSSLLRFDGC